MFHSSLCPHHRPVRKTPWFLDAPEASCARSAWHVPCAGCESSVSFVTSAFPGVFWCRGSGEGFFWGCNSVAAKSRRCESGLERIDLIDFQYHGLIAAAWLARFLPEQLEVTGSCGATWSWMHRFCLGRKVLVTVRFFLHHSELTLGRFFFSGGTWHLEKPINETLVSQPGGGGIGRGKCPLDSHEIRCDEAISLIYMDCQDWEPGVPLNSNPS